jgi:hypothetical protein
MTLDGFCRQSSGWSRRAGRGVVQMRLMDDRGKIRGGLSLPGGPGVDLSPQQEDESEVVEEDQQYEVEP